MSTPSRLAGAAALVTGAATGLGKGIALELARAGCRVALNYLENETTAAEAAAEVAAFGTEAFAVQGDVRSSAAVRAIQMWPLPFPPDPSTRVSVPSGLNSCNLRCTSGGGRCC